MWIPALPRPIHEFHKNGMHMTCFSAKRQSSAYLDGRLRSTDSARIAAHVRECDSCSSHFEQLTLLRSGLKRLPSPSVPAIMRTRLRVLASQERVWLLQTQGSRWASLVQRWKFRLDEFMRPLTIPATGGILSSVALFATLAFSISHTAHSVAYEVPVAYRDRLDATLIPVDMRSAVVLTMDLDGRGRIRDYSVRDGADSYTGDAGRLVYNNISLPQFPSVLAEAQPVSGAVRISLTPIVFRQ